MMRAWHYIRVPEWDIFMHNQLQTCVSSIPIYGGSKILTNKHTYIQTNIETQKGKTDVPLTSGKHVTTV